MRIPPSSLVSPGCCTLSRCVRLRGYTRERGAPVILTILLFQKYCRQFMCMEMEILLVFIPGILSKRCLHECYTGSWTRKTLRQPKGLTTIYFQQVDNFIGVSSYPEGGIMRRIRMKCQKAISILIDTCRTAHSWKLFSLSVQVVENIT